MIHTFTPRPWRLLTVCLLVNWSPSWIMSCALYPVWTLLWIELPSCALCFWWELPRRASAPKFHILIKSQRWAPQKCVMFSSWIWAVVYDNCWAARALLTLGGAAENLAVGLPCLLIETLEKSPEVGIILNRQKPPWLWPEAQRSGCTYCLHAVRLHILPLCSQVAHTASMQSGRTYCLHSGCWIAKPMFLYLHELQFMQIKLYINQTKLPSH